MNVLQRIHLDRKVAVLIGASPASRSLGPLR